MESESCPERKAKRRRTLAADTPDTLRPRNDVTIVEDSVFDTSQVPDTAERTRLLLSGNGAEASLLLRSKGLKLGPNVQRKLVNLPSLLPGEETFVSQSQKVALSSTVLDNSPLLNKSSKTNINTSRRNSSRRSNINKDDLLSFILNRSPKAVSSSVKGSSLTEDSSHNSDSDDEEADNWRQQNSVHGSVQKYLAKPLDPRQSVLISGNVKSRTRACLSKPKAQNQSQQPRKLVKKLDDDLKRRSLVNDTILEVTEPGSKQSSEELIPGSGPNSKPNSQSSHIDPKLMVASYQNFSTDSAKAMIAQMENGDYVSDKSAVRTDSVSSCDSETSNDSKGSRKKPLEKTSLSPVPMAMATPAPSVVNNVHLSTAQESPSLRQSLESQPNFAPTQSAPLLEGVNIFVDFRSGHDNMGKAIEGKASALGAKISGKLGPDVTHVVFKDGSLANWKKSKRLGTHIVAVSWIEDSLKNGRLMPEADYPSVSRDKYESPGLFPKLRKLKSMQPKTLEEDYATASKSLDRKLRVQARKNLLEEKRTQSDLAKTKKPPHNHYYKGCEKFYNRSKTDDSSLQRLMNAINSPGVGTPPRVVPSGSPPLSPSNIDYDSPLAERLARKYQSPLELRQRNSMEATLNATPVRAADCFRDKVNDSEKEKDITVETSNLQDKSNESHTTSKSRSKRAISKATRGRKRKVEEAAAQVDSDQTVSSVSVPRTPLKDVSNKTRKHKLFKASQFLELEETFDKSQPSRVEYIENVHVTAKKKAAPKSPKDSTAKKTKEKSEKANVEDHKAKDETKTRSKKISRNRRKTSFDFQPPKLSSSAASSSSQLSSQGRTKFESYIALTSCDKEDKDLAKQLVKQLGVFGYHDSINEKTTHIVSGSSKRTINLVKGMVRGCWIVTKNWLMDSMEQGHWVVETEYEMVAFSPSVRTVREERQLFKGAFKSHLFIDVGAVYISSKCRVSRQDLRQVILWGGGKVVNTARVASVVVGEFCHVGDSSTPQFVTDNWILDSVQHNMVMPFLDYPL